MPSQLLVPLGGAGVGTDFTTDFSSLDVSNLPGFQT